MNERMARLVDVGWGSDGSTSYRVLNVRCDDDGSWVQVPVTHEHFARLEDVYGELIDRPAVVVATPLGLMVYVRQTYVDVTPGVPCVRGF